VRRKTLLNQPILKHWALKQALITMCSNLMID